MEAGDIKLCRAAPPQRGRRGPRDDWNPVREYVRKAAGEWCQVLATKAPKAGAEGVRARLYQRAKWNLRGGDFDVTSRVESGVVRVYARLRGPK